MEVNCRERYLAIKKTKQGQTKSFGYVMGRVSRILQEFDTLIVEKIFWKRKMISYN